MSVTLLAVRQVAERPEGEGGHNFLLPNGTFFVILAIFLIVLAVISTFVVPSITRVLRQRENMVVKTAADNKESAERFAAAQADYEEELSKARVEASTARDDARAAGRRILEEMRLSADERVASTLENAREQLKREGEAVAEQLRARLDATATTLASRILGVSVDSVSTAGAPLASGTAGR